MSKVLSVLRKVINEFMSRPGYRPLTRSELAKALMLEISDRRSLRFVLKELEAEGSVECLRKNRWAPVVQQKKQEWIGRVFVRTGGLCLVRLDHPKPEDPDEVVITEGARAGALPEDRVAVIPDRGRARVRSLPNGKIIRILERSRETVVGLFRHTPETTYLIPDEQGIPPVRILGVDSKRAVQLELHKVVIRLADWNSQDPALRGELEEVLGLEDAPGVDMLCLMRRREYRQDFPLAVRRAAKKAAGSLTAEDLTGRLDLRAQLTFTVDPETARDFDDAVSIEEQSDGTWKLGVHIADVGHFVAQNDAVDKEASRRGNTVYLVDRAILMLPPELTAETCSLTPDCDRLTRSVLMHLDSSGRVQHVEMH